MPKYAVQVRVRGKTQQRTYYAIHKKALEQHFERMKAKRCIDIDVESIEPATRNEKEVK